MLTPVEIDFRNLAPAAALSAAIRKRCRELDALCPDLLGCEVWLVPCPCSAQRDPAYEAGLRLRLSGQTIAASTQARTVLVAIHHAFDGAQRQLEAHVQGRQGTRRRVRHHLPDFQAWSDALAGALS